MRQWKQYWKQKDWLFVPLMVFLWLQLTVWHDPIIGLLVFVFYVWLVGSWWRRILRNIFFMKEKNVMTHVFAWSVVSIILGYVVSICIVWYRFTPVVLFFSYLVTGCCSAVLAHFVAKRTWRKKMQAPYPHNTSPSFRLCKMPKVLYLVYLVLWGFLVWILVAGRSSTVAFTPWQVISSYYVPLFFLLSCVLGALLVSTYKTKALLFLVVLHSFLLHAYLPLSHVMPWGGDVWRTMAVEKQIIDGEYIYPVLVGHGAEWVTIGPFDVPRIFMAPHKYIYGHLWGVTVLLAETMGWSLLHINIWLVPILWSLLMPLIFFRMGRLLYGTPRLGLWFSALTSIPFSLQALGGLTLAVSLGTIVFFFTLMLCIQYLRERVPCQRNIVLMLAVLSLFGYSLYALLTWLILGISLFLSLLSRYVIRPVVSKSLVTVMGFVSIFFIPVVELLAKTSYVPEQLIVWAGVRQLVGQFSGWFYATMIRPHDILSGNIFVNHTPQWAFVENMFTVWRYHVLILMLLVFLGIGMKLFHILLEEKRREWHVMALLFLALCGGYALGWGVLAGDRSFVRRLDPALAVFFLVFAFSGWRICLQKIRIRFLKKYRVVVALLGVVFFSWTTATIYASGPDMRVVSTHEFDAAQAVVELSQAESPSYCVIANTWVLLAVEAVSSGTIVGGGFPIDYQFGQPELAVLYTAMVDDPRESIFTVAQEKTKSMHCIIAIDIDGWSEEKKAQIREIVEEEGRLFGSILVGRQRLNIDG